MKARVVIALIIGYTLLIVGIVVVLSLSAKPY